MARGEHAITSSELLLGHRMGVLLQRCRERRAHSQRETLRAEARVRSGKASSQPPTPRGREAAQLRQLVNARSFRAQDAVLAAKPSATAPLQCSTTQYPSTSPGVPCRVGAELAGRGAELAGNCAAAC